MVDYYLMFGRAAEQLRPPQMSPPQKERAQAADDAWHSTRNAGDVPLAEHRRCERVDGWHSYGWICVNGAICKGPSGIHGTDKALTVRTKSRVARKSYGPAGLSMSHAAVPDPSRHS